MLQLYRIIAFACSLLAVECLAADAAPKESLVGRVAAGEGLALVSPLELGSLVRPGGWRLGQLGVRRAEKAVGVKLGRDALVLFGTAEGAGKGDFAVSQGAPGEMLALGAWFHLPAEANVKEVGFQVYDRDGEVLMHLVPADWQGWKWIETDMAAGSWKQAYPQADKNGQLDMPLRAVHIVWFAKQAGLSEVTVDALVARVRRPEGDSRRGVSVELLGATDIRPGETYGGSLLLSNASSSPATVEIELSLQRDGRLFDRPLPDPLLGCDHALAARSWTVAEGRSIAENTLTDGLDYTSAETPYRKDYWESAEQFVELDRPREVTALGWQSGDANWVWKVDVAASLDGKTFTAVPELKNVEMHKKWGRQRFRQFKPFRAKVLRLHYHNAGQKTNVVRMPSAISIWDGAADESFDVPQAGEELQRLQTRCEVPPGAFAVETFDFEPKLATGQYLLASRTRTEGTTRLAVRHVFVEPGWLEGVDERSRFGLNASRSSLAKEHRQLGIGWVRFENFKWPFVSAAPHEYAFDGTVRPWVVNIDQVTADYREAGLSVLPMMFLTPQWAAAGGEVAEGVRLAQPPKEPADFGEFAFQSVARYGSRRVAAEELKTKDRLTGLGRIKVFELGNEPNLNPLRDPKKPPTWGPWAGTMDQWWTMWRYGAEAVKRADPKAVLASPGFAGMTNDIVDQMRVHKYPDGKCPLDLIDVVSVHFYSGRTPPERAAGDVNNAQGYDVSFVEHLKRLVEWRDRYKPGAPIWMTETGYDTGGPIGTNERTQAARLPRVVGLCLAEGLDKVFVYRESGSTPSQHAASGVLREDLSRRPSWYTYATLIRQLHGAQPKHRLPHPGENVWLQSWQRDGKTLLVAYCITGEATLGIELGPATVTDAFGGVTRPRSTRELPLSEFPIYLSDIADEAALRPLIQQADESEAARRRQRQREAERNVYLFNFGEPREPIAADIGRLRYYESVPAARLYDAKTRFGFVEKPATLNDYRHWMSSDVEKYSVKLDKGQQFRCDVKPGRYELRINAQPWSETGDLVLDGVDGGPVNLTFRKGNGETLARSIAVTGGPLTLTGTYQHLVRWLLLEEAEKP